MPAQSRQDLLDALPPEWPEDPLPAIREHLARDGRVVVILDDDPTGTQTVHGVPVVTVWDEIELTRAIGQAETLLYVLTNSRALPGAEAASLATRLGAMASRAARAAGREIVMGVRGDSTLRGHFPIENLALAKAMAVESGERQNGTLVVPFFGEGGRLTIHGVHYVAEGDRLVPAGETEFARDASFGYSASYLPDWVQEKSGGVTRAADVVVIPIELLRQGGPDAVAERLSVVRGGKVAVADSVTYRDVEVLVLGLLSAEQAGRRLVYRSAASFYRARGGQGSHPLLGAADLLPGQAAGPGGLVVVGSHTQRTTQQLERLLALPDLDPTELNVADVLDPHRRDRALQQVAERIEASLSAESPRDAVVYTSRTRQDGLNADDSLRVAREVSEALVDLVRQIRRRPRFMIAKGGITASDLGTRALGVRHAWVPGQVAPGVPIWILGPETPFPGLPYIVFPGNVGTPDTLAEVALRLRGG